MPIKKYKPLSPDPLINKIKGDTEFARLAHLNNLVDQVNEEIGSIVPGGGGTNPTSTYIPYNNAGTFADSFLVNDTDLLKTIYGGNDVGLKLDFVNGDVYLGDPFGVISSNSTSVYMYITPGSEGITLNVGGKTYFSAEAPTDFCYVGVDTSKLVFTNGSSVRLNDGSSTYNGFEIIYNASLSDITDVKIGDYTNITTGTSIITDVANSIIKTQDGGIDQGLALNFASNTYEFGYLNGGSNESKIAVFDGEILTKWHGLFRGFDMVLTDQTYYIGSMGPSPNFYIELSNEQTNPFQHLKLIRNNQADGLNIDFVNNVYQFGNLYTAINGPYNTSIGNTQDGVYMDITGDSSSGTCIMKVVDTLSPADTLFYYENDASNQFFKFGYLTGNECSIYMQSDSGQDLVMRTVMNGAQGKGFILNATTNVYDFGDTGAGGWISIDGNNSTIQANTQTLLLDDGGTGNLLVNIAGGNSGLHLPITINGTIYKIKLENN